MDEEVTGLGERLKAYRESLGCTQAEMAERLGASKPGYKHNEQGKSAPGSKLLSELCKSGLNVNWLLTGQGSMRTDEAESPEQHIKAYGDGLVLLETALKRLNRTLEPEKKRVALDNMYRAWARERKVDPKLIEMIVELAA